MLKVLVLVALFALAVYLVVRMLQRGGGAAAPRRKPSTPPTNRRVVAPDDDPEFLRDLDRKRLHPDDPDA